MWSSAPIACCAGAPRSTGGSSAPGCPSLKDRERARMIAALALMDEWSADRIAGSFDGGQYRPALLTPVERALAQALQGESLDHPEQPLAVRYEFPGLAGSGAARGLRRRARERDGGADCRPPLRICAPIR